MMMQPIWFSRSLSFTGKAPKNASSFSTERLKDIFNEYTGNPYEEVFYPEQEITAKTEIDYTRTRRDLKILLEKDELSTEDEKLVELCASITEKFECY